MFDKLDAIVDRFYYLEEKLSDPETLSDMKIFAKVNKEYKDLKTVVETIKQYQSLSLNLEGSKQLLSDSDPDVREMAQAEIDELLPELEETTENLKFLKATRFSPSNFCNSFSVLFLNSFINMYVV